MSEHQPGDVTADHEANAGYIYLRPIADGEVHQSQRLGKHLVLDYDQAGDLLGVELLTLKMFTPPAPDPVIQLEPSPSVQKAKDMLADPDGYFARARTDAGFRYQQGSLHAVSVNSGRPDPDTPPAPDPADPAEPDTIICTDDQAGVDAIEALKARAVAGDEALALLAERLLFACDAATMEPGDHEAVVPVSEIRALVAPPLPELDERTEAEQ